MGNDECQEITKLLVVITGWMESATKDQAIEYQKKLKLLVESFT